MIPAAPGWRVVLADRENSGSVALPIVAWERREEMHQVAPPRSRPADPPSIYTIKFLRAWYVPYETGLPPQPLSDRALVCGYLSPGQEWGPNWDEIANELLRMEREEEDREAKRGS